MSKASVKALKDSRVKASSASTLQPFNASTLEFENHQRTKPLDRARLKKITLAALAELGIEQWNLTFYFVDAKRMAEINQAHMHHEGPTDVITFDYSDPAPRFALRLPSPPRSGRGIKGEVSIPHSAPSSVTSQRQLFGEIFICPAVAVTQAREFRTTWQSELVRYIVHALLHLCGYDDLKPAARREMKRHENRLVQKLSKDFGFAKI